MGILDSLFGDKSKTKSTSTNTASGTSDSITEQDLLEAISTLSKGTVTKGGTRETQLLDMLQRELPTRFEQYSKQNAITDSQAAVNSAMDRVLNLGLPEIRTAGSTSGGYDATTTKLLKDNLVTKAAAAGADIQMKAIDDYANKQLQAVREVLNAVGLGQEGNVVNDVTEAQNRNASTDTKENKVFDTEEEGTGVNNTTGRSSIFGQISGLVGAVSGG